MKHQKRIGNLAALIPGGLGQLHIGGKLPLLIKLLHTGSYGLPWNNLGCADISGCGTFCDMDAILGIPRCVSDAACLNTVASMEFPGKELRQLRGAFTFGSFCDQVHPAVFGVAAVTK